MCFKIVILDEINFLYEGIFMYYRLFYFILGLFFPLQLTAIEYGLKDALSYVRKEAKEFKELIKKEEAYQEKILSLDAFYEPIISASSSYVQDQLESQLSQKQRSLHTNFDLNYSKQTKYGTSYKLSFMQHRNELFFGNTSSSTQVGEISIPIYNPASMFKKNPDHKTSWSLELSQSLNRNLETLSKKKRSIFYRDRCHWKLSNRNQRNFPNWYAGN